MTVIVQLDPAVVDAFAVAVRPRDTGLVTVNATECCGAAVGGCGVDAIVGGCVGSALGGAVGVAVSCSVGDGAVAAGCGVAMGAAVAAALRSGVEVAVDGDAIPGVLVATTAVDTDAGGAELLPIEAAEGVGVALAVGDAVTIELAAVLTAAAAVDPVARGVEEAGDLSAAGVHAAKRSVSESMGPLARAAITPPRPATRSIS